MALPQYNTEELIKNIKRRCAVPTSQLTYQDQDFCDLANDEMQGSVVPLIMSTREEYFVTHEDFTLDSTGEITIPTAAVGEKLRSVCYVSQQDPLILINLPRLELDVIAGIGTLPYTTFAGFYVEDNKIKMYPNTSIPQNTNIRLYYYNRTLNLIAPNQYGQITSIDTNAVSIVVDYVPSSWTTGTVLNAVSSTPAFKTMNTAMTIASISSPTIFLDTVDDLSVGDYVSMQGYAAVPQIPLEAHAYLAQLTAVKALEGLGDRAGMEAAQAKANELKDKMLIMISQRVDGSVKKAVNPNGGLRFGAGLGYWGVGGRGGSW